MSSLMALLERVIVQVSGRLGRIRDGCRAFARRALGIKIAGRGRAHRPLGQSQADAGIVFEMTTLDGIHAIEDDHVVVDAGVTWRDLVLATTAVGRTPPVLTDYLNLTVAGTLSVGGVSTTSFRHGAQVDNVLELTVVTGTGEVVVCSASSHRHLFDAALAGLGLTAVIVGAKLRLVPAEERAHNFQLFYADLPTLLGDLTELGDDGRFDSIQGQGLPGQGGFTLLISATKFYTPDEDDDDDATPGDELLEGLHFIPGSTQVSDTTYFAFVDQVDTLIDVILEEAGLNALPHPWLDLFVPGSVAGTFLPETVAGLDLSLFLPGSLLLFYTFNRQRLERPALRVPDEPRFFLFDILRTVPPDPGVVSAVLQQNRALYDQNVAQGGTEYTISAVALSPADWQAHFGTFFPALVAAKAKYDPSNVLGAGLDVFP
jgi:hypothetical protein